jgi:transposase
MDQPMFVGVDVSKRTLSICIHGSENRRDLPNEEAAIVAWLATLARTALIAVESTGRYHQRLVRLAHASGRRVYVLNARDVYFYAKALGARGKTDRTDARVIVRYLAEHHGALRAWMPAGAVQERLQQLLHCRAGVASKRSALVQMLRDVPGLEASIRALLRQFDKLLDEIDARVTALLEEDPQLADRCRKLRTIPGIGLQGSAMLGALFSRLPFANSDALIAYSGLDPRPDDSGRRSGRRRLCKRGSALLRRQMYLAAFAACHSKMLGPLYRSIKARGFKPTQALVILARKLLRVAWALWRTEAPFDPAHIGPVQA